jgi:hypothetical protein
MKLETTKLRQKEDMKDWTFKVLSFFVSKLFTKKFAKRGLQIERNVL